MPFFWCGRPFCWGELHSPLLRVGKEFIRQREIKKAIIGTNNPISLSLIMHFQKSIEIDGYIYKDMEEVNQEERDVEFRVAEPDECERLVNFDNTAYGAVD